MSKSFFLLLCVLWLIGCKEQSDRGGAQDPSSVARPAEKAAPKVSVKDHEFMTYAARANLAEIRVAQVGLQKAESQRVKDFLQRLVKEHAEAHQELKEIALQKQVMLPDGMTDEQKNMTQHLAGLEGKEFDQAFQKHAVEEHQKDIEHFSYAAEKSDDPELKSFANKVLPILQQHLEAAKALDSTTASTP